MTLARQFAGKHVLDYGCGDGTFLAMALLSGNAPAACVGAELSVEHVEECSRRYHGESRLSLCAGTGSRRCTAPHHLRRRLLHGGARARGELGARSEQACPPAAPEGRLIVSVPVETGLPLLIKQSVRRVAGWRGIGHYPPTTSYSLAELASGVWAGSTQHVSRPVFDLGDGPFHDHKGFNWMVLREFLSRQFIAGQCIGSPFAWLGPGLATQVWFVARRRP